jgi:hypothetical protein
MPGAGPAQACKCIERGIVTVVVLVRKRGCENWYSLDVHVCIIGDVL